jgi:hypothetical protein
MTFLQPAFPPLHQYRNLNWTMCCALQTVSYDAPLNFFSISPVSIDGNDEIYVQTMDESTHVYAIGGGGMDDIQLDANVATIIGDYGSMNIMQTSGDSVSDLAKLSIYTATGELISNKNDRLGVSCSSRTNDTTSLSRAVAFGGEGDDILDIKCAYSVLCGDTCSCM